jgi:hypothetical protein
LLHQPDPVMRTGGLLRLTVTTLVATPLRQHAPLMDTRPIPAWRLPPTDRPPGHDDASRRCCRPVSPDSSPPGIPPTELSTGTPPAPIPGRRPALEQTNAPTPALPSSSLPALPGEALHRPRPARQLQQLLGLRLRPRVGQWSCRRAAR